MSAVASRRRTTYWGLAFVVILAWAHAGTHAVVRPLFQISDEVVYLSTVQAAALSLAGPELARCIAPPAGVFARIPVSTKTGFVNVTALQLKALCTGGPARTWPLLALRLVQALSLGVVALSAYLIACTLTGRESDGMLAGLLAAGHPVAATHAGGVTPDAWANAFAAISLLAATRMLLDRARWWDAPVLVVAPILAVAWKDTATFLLLLPVITLGIQAKHLYKPGRIAGLYLLVLGAAMALLAAAGLQWFRTPYFPGRSIVDAVTQLHSARAIVADALSQSAGMITSSWTALGNFGASTLTMSTTAATIGLATLCGSVIGGWRRLNQARPAFAAWPVLLVWVGCGVLCLIQPSVRQVLLSTQDIHQGRWLFPMLAPAAAVVACGLNGFSRTRSLQPLWILCALTPAWLALIDLTRYYWLAYPRQLMEPALYLRGTGGDVLDDQLLLELARYAAASLPTTFAVLMPSLLALASAVCVAQVLTSPTGVFHVRSADHR